MYIMRIDEFQALQKNEQDLIINASTTDGHDRLRPFTIGTAWYRFEVGYTGVPPIGTVRNSELVLCAVWPRAKRPIIIENLRKNGIHNNMLSRTDYFNQLPKYKFCISPEGNGVDCHRTYEALIEGVIPICQYSRHIENIYRGCPILWTTDYSEITPAYLEEKWNEMKDKDYDFSRLFLSSYPPETRAEIIKSGNYWCNTGIRRTIYKY